MNMTLFLSKCVQVSGAQGRMVAGIPMALFGSGKVTGLMTQPVECGHVAAVAVSLCPILSNPLI